MPRPRIGWNGSCDMVCVGQLDIATAQEAFAKDWIAAYHNTTKFTDAKLWQASRAVAVGRPLLPGDSCRQDAYR